MIWGCIIPFRDRTSRRCCTPPCREISRIILLTDRTPRHSLTMRLPPAARPPPGANAPSPRPALSICLSEVTGESPSPARPTAMCFSCAGKNGDMTIPEGHEYEQVRWTGRFGNAKPWRGTQCQPRGRRVSTAAISWTLCRATSSQFRRSRPPPIGRDGWRTRLEFDLASGHGWRRISFSHEARNTKVRME